MMDYSIGKVSKILGLSVEGIRNYEKSGIITSRRDSESNYRKYSYLDVASLIRAKMYRSYGYSLREVRELTNDMPLEDITAALAHKEDELVREIHLLEEKRHCLNSLRRMTQSVAEKAGKVEICRMNALYRIEFACNGEIDFSDETVELLQEWMKYAPFVFFSSRYQGDTVYGGLAIQERYASLFDIGQQRARGLPVSFLPSVLCLRITVQEGDSGYSRAQTLAALEEYASAHNFVLSGERIGYTVMGIHKYRDYQRYRQVYAAILNA